MKKQGSGFLRFNYLALLFTLLTASVGLAASPSSSSFSPAPAQKSVEAMCREAGEIQPAQLTASDKKAFADKAQSFYPVLQLAEAISKRNAYKKDNNRLVLQLICHEGFMAPLENEVAVKDAYHHWQSGEHFLFNICNYVSSGATQGFCAERRANQQELDRKHALKNVLSKLKPDQQNAVNEAYKAAINFYTEKADKEEFNAGTSRAAYSFESVSTQKNQYIARISNTLEGKLPLEFPDYEKADRTLNDVWHKVKARLEGKPITDLNMTISFSGVRDVQRQWLVFRDKTASMLAMLNPGVTVQQWKGRLTQERTKELLSIAQFK